MKTKTVLFFISLLTIISCGSASQNSSNDSYRVNGNRKVVTKKIKISDYDEIAFAGSMYVEYEQSSSPFFEITVDENILPLLNIEVKNRKLVVDLKSKNNRVRSINPTVFKIKTRSKRLKEVNMAGSGNFVVKGGLKFDYLELNKAGSGEILLAGTSKGESLKARLSGSGCIKVNKVNVDHLDGSVAGSGLISLEGKANSASYRVSGSGKINVDVDSKDTDFNIAGSGKIMAKGSSKEAQYSISGSGKIEAYNYKADNVKASVAGSGKIELYAKNRLYASGNHGSGKIYYKGKAKLEKQRTKDKSVIYVN